MHLAGCRHAVDTGSEPPRVGKGMTKGAIPIMDRVTTWDTVDTTAPSTSYEGFVRRNKTSATRTTRLVPLAVAFLLITIFLFGVLLPVAHMFQASSGAVVVP